MTNKIPVLAIVGPTATGKTSLSVQLAKDLNGEIVSADSMQIYKRMDIGTAKVTPEEMQGIPHHLVDIIEPTESFSVAEYVKRAKKAIEEINKKGKLPVVTGGTGLYINSLLQNVAFGDFPNDKVYRDYLKSIAEDSGGITLIKMLDEVDSKSAKRLHENDIFRLTRALEVYKVTGKPLSHWIEESKKQPSPYGEIIIGLNYRNREMLYEKINLRVDDMIEKGLVKEVENLINEGVGKKATSMQAIGYKEIVEYLNGLLTLDEAINKVKAESRRYAKRQMTWFKANKKINWIYVDEKDNNFILKEAKNILELFV